MVGRGRVQGQVGGCGAPGLLRASERQKQCRHVLVGWPEARIQRDRASEGLE